MGGRAFLSTCRFWDDWEEEMEMHQRVASCTHTRLPMHHTAHSVNACNDREVQATCWCVPVARHADIGKELLVGGGGTAAVGILRVPVARR